MRKIALAISAVALLSGSAYAEVSDEEFCNLLGAYGAEIMKVRQQGTSPQVVADAIDELYEKEIPEKAFALKDLVIKAYNIDRAESTIVQEYRVWKFKKAVIEDCLERMDEPEKAPEVEM